MAAPLKAWFFTILCVLPSLGSPVINEILYRPGTGFPENTALEYIELHNPGTLAVDLGGWALTEGVAFTFPAGTTIPAGGYLVIAADPAALMAASGFSGALGPWASGNTLSNGGETVSLSAPDGSGGMTVVDEVRYADEGDWAVSTRNTLGGWSWITPASSAGASVERRNPLLASDKGQNWAASVAAGGTPGARNSRFTANIAPVIEKVRHTPAVPKSHEVVTISCQLVDESAAENIAATLYWRDATAVAPGPFQALAMTHDGGGRFVATLGARADKTIVEFYIQSTDGAASRTWPAPTSEGQNANCTYQVDNEVINTSAAAYRLVLTAAENAAYNTLAATNPQSDREFNLTFIAHHGEETTIRYCTRMRIRGQSSRNFIHKPLRISIPSDNRWDGVSEFSLNPKFPWVQFLGMRALQAAGLAAGDSVPVELRRNGVESVTGSGTNPDYGMWVRIEAINGDYVDNHFPGAPDVQLYRKNAGSTMWSSNFTPPAHPDGTYSGWSKQNQSGRNDWSDLVNFSTVWQTVAAPYFPGSTPGNIRSGTWNQQAFSDAEVAQLETVADLDQMARWLAVMTILNNTEHNISNGFDNDYGAAFVSDGVNRRMKLLPHDLDNLLGKGDSPKSATEVGLFAMTAANDSFSPLMPLLGNSQFPGNPGFRQKYLTAIRELYGSVFDSDTSANPNPPFHAWIDNHLGSWVPSTVRGQLKTYMTTRQSYLLGLIGAGKIPPQPATSSGTHDRPPSGPLRINEVLAVNTSTYPAGGTFPDYIELHNTGPTNIGISGFKIADEGNTYTFPAGSGNVPAGGYRIIHSGTLGFGLGSKGDTVRLLNAADVVLDEVPFGPQVPDLAIARDASGLWVLAAPTPDAPNGPALALGSVSAVRLNEWAGNTRYRLSDDFVELFNPTAQPLALAGLRLTDDIASYPSRHQFPPLSFIGASAFLELDSDVFGFGLDGHFDSLWLTGSNGAIIDQAALVAQHADTSAGRSPDGGFATADFALPSPGISNGSATTGYEDLLEGLRITEIMFAPTTDPAFEFVEFQNIGTTTLSLGGVRLTSGIDYTFAPGTTLAPDDYLVVCKDRVSFLTRYPGASGKLAAGAFTGTLSDSGETLALTLPVPWDLNILRFSYSPAWYPASAGGGRSLVTRDQGVTHPADWKNSETWQASSSVNGSPGSGEPPQITSATSADGIIGDAFSYRITATRSPTSFAATGLPAGLSLDTVTGLISGAPQTGGVFPVQISATRGTETATRSLTLSVTAYGEFHHIRWDHVPATAYTGIPFTVQLSARDIGGRLIQDFNGTVALTAGTTDSSYVTNPGGAAPLNPPLIPSPILITELTDEGEDQFELQNVSGLAADTTGWFVVLGDSLTNINTRNATTFLLPASMAPGQLLRVSDINTVGRTYFGSAIGWNHASTNPSRGWVMVFDGSARLRDFVAFGWNATQLGSLSITVSGRTVSPVASGHWSGPGLAVGTRGVPSNTTDSWIRAGSSDANTSTHWNWAQYGTSFGVTNTGLNTPWEVVYPLTVLPSSVTFTQGEFFGKFRLSDSSASAFLTATAASGPGGRSPLLAVLPGTDADNDGLPDAWETQFGLSGNNPGDAATDSDGDGQGNLAEYEAGTHPQLASSVFAIRSGVLDAGGNAFALEWPAVAGKSYRVYSSPDLVNWNHRGTIFAAESGLRTFPVPTHGASRLFFHISVEP